MQEIAKGFILRTLPQYRPFIEQLFISKRSKKLISQASLEVLSIVAYKQPITRLQIDEIRGVDSSGSLYKLLEKQLVEVVGKLDVIKKPSLYGTTQSFLKHFGLKSIKDLRKTSARL